MNQSRCTLNIVGLYKMLTGYSALVQHEQQSTLQTLFMDKVKCWRIILNCLRVLKVAKKKGQLLKNCDSSFCRGKGEGVGGADLFRALAEGWDNIETPNQTFLLSCSDITSNCAALKIIYDIINYQHKIGRRRYLMFVTPLVEIESMMRFPWQTCI